MSREKEYECIWSRAAEAGIDIDQGDDLDTEEPIGKISFPQAMWTFLEVAGKDLTVVAIVQDYHTNKKHQLDYLQLKSWAQKFEILDMRAITPDFVFFVKNLKHEKVQ